MLMQPPTEEGIWEGGRKEGWGVGKYCKRSHTYLSSKTYGLVSS